MWNTCLVMLKMDLKKKLDRNENNERKSESKINSGRESMNLTYKVEQLERRCKERRCANCLEQNENKKKKHGVIQIGTMT